MGPTKLIFFDLGETLVTQNIEDNMVTKRALEDISKILPNQVPLARMLQLYRTGYRLNDSIRSEYNVEIPIDVWMRQFLERLGGKAPTERLVRESIKRIVNRRAENAIAFDDTRATIARLAMRKIRLGIISNVSSHDVAIGILKKTKLDKYFDPVVTSASAGVRKPDPGIFRYALDQVGARPEESIMVGDSERHDILGGHIAGLGTVLVNRKRALGGSNAQFRFKSLSEAEATLQSL